MATASGNTANTSAGETSGSNVPQWKRELIQRRRQQNKVLASNGASVKLCSAVFGSSTTTTAGENSSEQSGVVEQFDKIRTWGNSSEENVAIENNGIGGSGLAKPAGASSTISSSRSNGTGGATVGSGAVGGTGTTVSSVSSDFVLPPVACNMRLEADLSLCSDTEDTVNGAKSPTDMEGNSENDESRQDVTRKSRSRELDVCEETRILQTARTKRNERDVMLDLAKNKSDKFLLEVSRNRMANEEPDSDSSEELQYGPGIVNRLKSKYLNLTLKEMNQSRSSVQRFRRAASLENLLDHDEEPTEKSNIRKYAKRNTGGNVSAKSDRYRNASRGNESMKRARSVETLMRYNAPEETLVHGSVGFAATNGLRQEPVNDHIILIDRTSVKIENRLGELEKPKALNKPKRVKPVLAETERPPPDLVKTTMRIFECSAKRVKPKGEVAAKVATFKTINDTLKAQNQKKIVPKPPLQPKPFVNGNSRTSGSPKKIVLPQKSTAELIENQDGQEYHMDGVITDPIVQSVSSVVSKFQQIEKAHSPSPSPEPTYKFKFSPAPSPEPSLNKVRPCLEINVKSPPATPIHSPRITSPRLQSPASPKKDVITRQISTPVQRTSPPSPSRELHKQTSAPELPKAESVVQECLKVSEDYSRQQQHTERVQGSANGNFVESKVRDTAPIATLEEIEIVDNEEEEEEEEEVVDGPKVITKSALDNIGKAGTTIQFNFNDKPNAEKNYLPGAKQNRQKTVEETWNSLTDAKSLPEVKGRTLSVESATGNCLSAQSESLPRTHERLEPAKHERKDDNNKEIEEISKQTSTSDHKPIGAICSLGLMRSNTTTTSYPQSNETKPLRSQKSETSSSSPPQKQIGIIRPLVTTKTQHPQQNLSNRELEKNLINRVKSIEQPTKVVVSLKSAEEIQPVKKPASGGGLWDTTPWNQQNNTMVFNFSNRKDVPDYIENDGLIIRRKREKPKVGDGGIIVLDATIDASTTDDAEWEISAGPPSPCDVSFLNDNILINGRSNLSRQPRNHKHRIQFDDAATRTFEYPSEAWMLEGESSGTDGATSGSAEQSLSITNKTSSSSNSGTNMPSLLGGSGLASYMPSKVDLASEGFELGVTKTMPLTQSMIPASSSDQEQSLSEVDYLKPAQDAGAWGSETTTGDLLY